MDDGDTDDDLVGASCEEICCAAGGTCVDHYIFYESSLHVTRGDDSAEMECARDRVDLAGAPYIALPPGDSSP